MSADSECFPPPNNPDEFESLCLDLWKDIWNDPGAEKNGRSGQPQAGVDLYGRPGGQWVGVQCKQKDGLLRSRISVAELEGEVCEGLKFTPKLRTFILATTGPADAKMQQRARELTEEHRAKGLFSVEVWSWEKIWQEIYSREELLRRIGPVYWSRHWRLIEERLKAPLRKRGLSVQGPVPQPPPHYLLRDASLAELRGKLLAGNTASVAITGQGTLGVQGMGGVGKTVLAAALTRDPDVQRAFPDGIFWLTLGQQPNLLAVLNQLAGWLPESDGPFTSEPAAQSVIRQALAGKGALLILDDVWSLDHAAALNLVSAPSRLLVTTRKREVLVGLVAQEFCVDVLSLPEALRMLADWARVKEPALLPLQATEVAQACGRLPLALAMIGAMVRMRPAAWSDALEFLRSHDLEEFRRAFPDYPYPDLLRAIAVSVDELPLDDRERYLDLAVFPEDEPIPEGPLQVLWGLTPAKTHACMDRLAERSLATIQQIRGKATLMLHDLQGDYIRNQREKELRALHTRLLDAYATRCEVHNPRSAIRNAANWPAGPDDGYFFQLVAWHLKQAGRHKELHSLLFDFNWLQAKLNVTDPVALLADFSHLENDKELGLVQSAIRLSSQAIGPDKQQLASQLVGRLSGETTPQARQLVDSAGAWRGGLWLKPFDGNLLPPGTGLLSTLHGHAGGILAVALTPDGRRAVSGSSDHTIKLWDVETGCEVRTLQGHVGRVTAVALSADGRRAVSGAFDQMLKAWDVESGRVLWTLKAHAGGVLAVALSADGRSALSGALDCTLKVWDVESGQNLRTLQGHNSGLKAVALSADGRRAAAGFDSGTLKLWEVASGRELRMFQGHAGGVLALALSADGCRAVSAGGANASLETEWRMPGSSDRTVKLWDMESGGELLTLQGHSDPVATVAITTDGRRAMSGAKDGTLKVWDVESGRELRILQGHAGGVSALALCADGRRAVSGSDDQTVKVWDTESGQRPWTLKGHTGGISAVAMSADGRWASTGANDGTLKVWEVRSGKELRTLAGLTDRVSAVALSADGRRVAFGADKGTLKVWDGNNERALCEPMPHWRADGKQEFRNAHSGPVNALVLSEDGRQAVSGSYGVVKVWDTESGKQLRVNWLGVDGLSADGRRAVSSYVFSALKVWDVESGREVGTVKGHTGLVRAVALSADGRRVASGFEDQTSRVWEVESGHEVGALKGHGGLIRALALSADGRRAASAADDRTLKVWDVQSGQCLATFTGESAMLCCAMAADGRTFVAAEESGRIHLLRLVLPYDPVEQSPTDTHP